MLDEFDSGYGYFCIEIDSIGCWSWGRDIVEIKFSESNRVMVSIIYADRARMYFLDRLFVEEFISKVLTAAHTPKPLDKFHHRSRTKVRLRWGSLSIAGFSVSGRATESELHSQEAALQEILEEFIKTCVNQSGAKIT